MSTCIFCEIASGVKTANVIHRFTYCYVLQDQHPVTKGHLLIIPNQHVQDWFSCPLIVRHEIIPVLDEMKHYLDREYSPQGYNIGANCGHVAGQTVMHMHLHIIPRYEGDMADPRGGVRGVIPEKQKY